MKKERCPHPALFIRLDPRRFYLEDKLCLEWNMVAVVRLKKMVMRALSGAMALLPDVIESVSIFARVKCPKVGNLFLISN